MTSTMTSLDGWLRRLRERAEGSDFERRRVYCTTPGLSVQLPAAEISNLQEPDRFVTELDSVAHEVEIDAYALKLGPRTSWVSRR